MTTKAEPKWWATPGLPDNHNYVIDTEGVQRCHLCGEVEPPLWLLPVPLTSTARAAMHLVHGVRAHLDVSASEWNRGR